MNLERDYVSGDFMSGKINTSPLKTCFTRAVKIELKDIEEDGKPDER